MTYRIGVVGVGHWASKFEEVMDGDLTFYSAVDVEPMDDKRDTLDRLGIPEERYDPIGPDEPLPESFLGDVDIVHIASPITEHRRQTIQALQDSDSLVVTEKAYGPTLDDHDAVQDAASREPNDTYLHLHYTRKLPTLALERAMESMEGEREPVQDVYMSFLEGFKQEDAERSWIFDPANGGIVLDWIHPMEVLVYACGAEFDGLICGSGVRTTDAYDVDHPTAAELTYRVDGHVFADDATATVRLGKGFPVDRDHKAARFMLDEGTLDVSYVSSDVERESPDRGVIAYQGAMDRLKGPDPYEAMAKDMVRALEEGQPPFTLDEGREMMSAVQLANDHIFADGRTVLEEESVVERMMEDALKDAGMRPIPEAKH